MSKFNHLLLFKKLKDLDNNIGEDFIVKIIVEFCNQKIDQYSAAIYFTLSFLSWTVYILGNVKGARKRNSVGLTECLV